MKLKLKKVLSLFLIILYSLTLLPVVSLAENASSAIFSEDFESAETEKFWPDGVRDNVGFEGDWALMVNNPYGDINSSIFGHTVQYNEYIHLEEGKFYTFSAHVLDPMADDESEPSAEAYMSNNYESLFIDISKVGYEWGYVSASFMATEDTFCKLIISCGSSSEDFGFFIDSIAITEEEKAPVYTAIEGPSRISIPENGSSVYRYNIVAYNEDDTKVNILMDSFNFNIDSLPEGIEFDSKTGVMIVSSSAKDSSVMVISCDATAGIELKSSQITVTATRNALLDPSFDDNLEMWRSEYDMEYADSMISLYAEEDGPYGKYTSISYTDQLLLIEGKMYVFKADVRSDEEFSSSSVYISNLSFSKNGYAEINITGIGGDWNRVTSAFIVEDTGLYDLTINLFAPTERPIYLDNVYLGAEEEAPTSISIRAPGNICTPQNEIILPCYANVLNQLGQVMDSLTPELSISPKTDEVYLSDGTIVVQDGAKYGDYIITATYEDIEANLTVTISDNFVGDGGFEEKEANEWWTSSDGSKFSIAHYDGDLSGHIYSPDSSCILINNSYMELLKGEYYVFNAEGGFGDATMTAFIADAYTGEYVPFAMYNNTEGVKAPFTLDNDIIGRLVIYIESDDEIGVFFDDISIVPAELSASEIVISYSGIDFVDGSYNYLNNMTNSVDADISSTRWYISPTYDGQYQPIGIPNQSYLEYTKDMVGQYLIYEVTPICSYTGLSAEPLRSLPFLIEDDAGDFKEDDNALSEMTPVELEDTLTHSFKDISAHWAEEMIATLSSKGIVSGRSTVGFVPEGKVTRAEFTAMIARAFSLSSIPYQEGFTDVSSSDWYSGWIEACYKRGIITGVSEDEFKPNDYITREQMATIIYRAYTICEGPMPNDIPLRYYDNFLISSWSYEAVKNCTNLNIITGKEANLFDPDGKATRAEAAAIIYRTLKCFY